MQATKEWLVNAHNLLAADADSILFVAVCYDLSMSHILDFFRCEVFHIFIAIPWMQ